MSIDAFQPPRMFGEAITRRGLLNGVQRPYCIEVIGMPNTGKTTCLNRFFQTYRSDQELPPIHLISEGAESIKSRYGDLRKDDPAQYVHLSTVLTRLRYMDALTLVEPTPDVIVADRGLADSMFFHQANEMRGRRLLPDKADDSYFAEWLAQSPVDRLGVIMFLARPECSFSRARRKIERSFFDDLYLLYLKFHLVNTRKSTLPYYACIDGEQDHEQVYQDFSRVLRTMLVS